jgi:hypothetical protein
MDDGTAGAEAGVALCRAASTGKRRANKAKPDRSCRPECI